MYYGNSESCMTTFGTFACKAKTKQYLGSVQGRVVALYNMITFLAASNSSCLTCCLPIAISALKAALILWNVQSASRLYTVWAQFSS